MREIRVLGVEGLPEIEEGADLGRLIAKAAQLENGDIVVVAQKIVSKAEGRIVDLDDVEPSARALELADATHDAKYVVVVLRESKRIVRTRGGFVIAETEHGFVCGGAGVDASNTPELGTLVLLPVDPDASARRIRDEIHAAAGVTVGVLVTDSFGRPWRNGTTDVAIGAAGLPVLLDLNGRRDRVGYELHATLIAVADEIASAAELVMGKTDDVPAAIVRGLDLPPGDASARELVMPAERDLFR